MSSTGEREEEKETGRLEAFSDGIFAVAITLLTNGRCGWYLAGGGKNECKDQGRFA